VSARSEVLVDMDGVLANFDASVEAALEQAYPEIEIVRPRTEFYIHEDYAEEHHAAIQGIWQAGGFYRQLGVVESAPEGWAQILEAGYKPRVCSSPIPQNLQCIDEKKAWLEEHFVPVFGHRIIDEAIFDRDKFKYDALALIDDKPSLPGAERATWQHILFETPYNKLSNSNYRLESWRDMQLVPILDFLYRSKGTKL
jgi:5'-nucleotidase